MKELLLRRDEIGGVELEQRLALTYQSACLVDVKLLDPAHDSRVHNPEPPFVRNGHGDGADGPLERSFACDREGGTS